ncbi:SMC-Scp complex subunit ScpB [Candidatus Uhrbacteria bacterium]|nr:SMC-Scp complex subunit ScpB [Candidatus Uhrbacteria bacterium]
MSKRPSTTLDLYRALEALLFLAGKPLSVRKVAELLGADTASARSAIDAFRTTWNARGGGTAVAMVGDEVQLVTHADLHEVAEAFVKDETRSELTRPQLEALTVIAYRGPITKAELEQIRGVHCGLILRNLLIRGLVEHRRDAQKHEDAYIISMDFLRHLGLVDVRALPEYERLHGSDIITQFLHHASGGGGAQVTPPAV